jgi:radical SAM-linked protein
MVKVLVKYSLTGTLRFLSHAETVRLFCRAMFRAGFDLDYSRGFRPRPRLSLPLPRPVGVQTDDDLLVVYLAQPEETGDFDCESFGRNLSAQLPEGLEILEVQTGKGSRIPRPLAATYRFEVDGGFRSDLKAAVDRIHGAKSLPLERVRKPDRGRRRRRAPVLVQRDAKNMLGPIDLDNGSGPCACATVECLIRSSGSLRLEEVMQLLDLSADRLVSPVRRTSVRWDYS